MPVTSKDIDFQHHMLSFFVDWVKIRGECSSCWYWWNWLPSLFKLSVHNHGSMILLISWPWPHDYIHFLIFMHNGSPYLVYLRIICDTMSSQSCPLTTSFTPNTVHIVWIMLFVIVHARTNKTLHICVFTCFIVANCIVLKQVL